MKLVADWGDVLGLIAYESEKEECFWLVIPETEEKVAAILENRQMLQEYVEAFVGVSEEYFDAKQAVHWALLKSLLVPERK